MSVKLVMSTQKGQEVPLSSSFNSFFSNDANKLRLQEFLFRELTDMVKLRIEKFFIIKEKCICLNTSKEEDNFICHKPEVDVRLFFTQTICVTVKHHMIYRDL